MGLFDKFRRVSSTEIEPFNVSLLYAWQKEFEAIFEKLEAHFTKNPQYVISDFILKQGGFEGMLTFMNQQEYPFSNEETKRFRENQTLIFSEIFPLTDWQQLETHQNLYHPLRNQDANGKCTRQRSPCEDLFAQIRLFIVSSVQKQLKAGKEPSIENDLFLITFTVRNELFTLIHALLSFSRKCGFSQTDESNPQINEEVQNRFRSELQSFYLQLVQDAYLFSGVLKTLRIEENDGLSDILSDMQRIFSKIEKTLYTYLDDQNLIDNGIIRAENNSRKQRLPYAHIHYQPIGDIFDGDFYVWINEDLCAAQQGKNENFRDGLDDEVEACFSSPPTSLRRRDSVPSSSLSSFSPSMYAWFSSIYFDACPDESPESYKSTSELSNSGRCYEINSPPPKTPEAPDRSVSAPLMPNFS